MKDTTHDSTRRTVALNSRGDAPRSVDRSGPGLRTHTIVFMVMSAAAPVTTVAASVPVTLAVTGTIHLPFFYLLAGSVLLIFAVGFTTMARHVRDAGAFYSYVQAGLGRVVGVGAATLAVVSYYAVQVGMSVLLGVTTSGLVESLTGLVIPWIIVSLILLLGVALLGYRDIELSGKVLGALLLVEVLAVVLTDLAILARGGAGGISVLPLLPIDLGTGAPILALMYAFLGFAGFEATAIFRNEARDPERTIPRATYASVALICVFYALSAWLVVLGQGQDTVVAAAADDPTGLFMHLASQYVAPVMFNVLQVLIVTSILASVVGFHNVVARYQLTMATAGVLPQWLAMVHPRHHAPSRSSVVTSSITIILVVLAALSGLDPILQVLAWLSGASSLGIMTLMALTSIAIVVYFRRRPRLAGKLWQTLVAPAVAAVLILLVAGVVVANFTDLVGGRLAAALIIGGLLASFTVGLCIALFLRHRDPVTFAQLVDG